MATKNSFLNNITHLITNNREEEYVSDKDEKNTNSNEITSETLKHTLKQLQNKRATMIASKLSGAFQDTQLKKDETYLKRIDAEVVRLRYIQQKNQAQLVSSLLIENGVLIGVEKVISKLEYMKYDYSERVRIFINK
jgi:hypothetical protein